MTQASKPSPTLGSAPRLDGHDLAAGHVLGPHTLTERGIRKRLRSLDRRFSRLFGIDGLAEGAAGDLPSDPSGREWLYENDFLVAEALETLDEALPTWFVRSLPGLREPVGQKGHPRVEAGIREGVGLSSESSSYRRTFSPRAKSERCSLTIVAKRIGILGSSGRSGFSSSEPVWPSWGCRSICSGW